MGLAVHAQRERITEARRYMNREVVLAAYIYIHAQREMIAEARRCVNREVVLAVHVQ